MNALTTAHCFCQLFSSAMRQIVEATPEQMAAPKDAPPLRTSGPHSPDVTREGEKEVQATGARRALDLGESTLPAGQESLLNRSLVLQLSPVQAAQKSKYDVTRPCSAKSSFTFCE